MADAGNVVHEDDRKLFVGALPQVLDNYRPQRNTNQRTLYEVVILLLKLEPLNGAIETNAVSRRLKRSCLVVDKMY